MICRCCGGTTRVLIDFGPQPPSNRFESSATETDRHPLTVGQCDCGLIQLIDPMSPETARPRFDWLRYKELEGHLDELVARLTKLAPDAGVLGLSYKDDSTLERLRYKPGNGLVIGRHILEHAHDPLEFLASVAAKAAPGGHIVLEVPDCTKFIEACDYSFLWEEHITYFTSETLAALIAKANLSLHEIYIFPSQYEDSLVAVIKNAPPISGKVFGHSFRQTRFDVTMRLRLWKAEGKRIAVFGAGHLTAKFINLLNLSEHIDWVIDDHEHKRGMFMPGSRLPIRGSDTLKEIDICLLGVGPESEKKVREKHPDTKFLSILALHPDSIYGQA